MADSVIKNNQKTKAHYAYDNKDFEVWIWMLTSR